MHYTTIQPRKIEHKRSSLETPLVVVTKKINAPVTTVFHAWKDADMIKQWWAPDGYSCSFADINFHVGEKYLLEMQSEDGREIWSTGIYTEIDPYRTLVFSSFSATSKDKITRLALELDEPSSKVNTEFVTVEFEDLEENLTKLTLCHEGIPAESQDDRAKSWSSTLDKLKSFVERQH